ncbi:LuxR C-terminal-related transcriptional regulator [Novosphingobium ginsenosidimutans]|uniref:LuxR family transcriptional regulator n=1 Tax=Novosphingobium ginsenosidimutans TaxID=1176536 RepID=A0A5B8S4M4_9SPHN|nr:LuxR C-terminal-related transcriptional regulator [Novosphingobium ginsenosidimutans]QEA16536.1 LuxR family transcriptional regulator [Novosphingobium ginsenosidimutans]
MDDIAKARAKLASLTEKQRAVLDLLIQHKSSKEIARTLDISPYTVDQRLGGARLKLGAASRGEVARAYAALLSICDESAYGFPYVEPDAVSDEGLPQAESLEPTYTFSDAVTLQYRAPWEATTEPAFGLEAFDNRFGKSGRVIAILGLAAVLALTLLALVSMAKTLSEMV